MNNPNKSRFAVFLFIGFLVLGAWSLVLPSRVSAACQCTQSSATQYRCNADCGTAFEGVDCVGDVTKCTTATNNAQCTQLNPQAVWLETFQMCADFQGFLNIAVIWGLLIATALALIRLVTGGIQFIYASGDPKALEEARATLTSAILGLILIVCSFLITKFIQGSLPTNWLIWFGIKP